MNEKELLLNLLDKPSVTPDDAGCFDVIESYLSEFGFQTEIVTFGAVKNLWAVHGNGQPLTVFAGHVDVVPPGDLSKWTTPPFAPTERGGYLYARGAADMKAGVATMCLAATNFVTQYPDYQGSIAIMLTADEEGPAHDGIKQLMPYLVERGVNMDYVIFGEPSSDKVLGDTIKNGRRGSMHVHLTILGQQGHVAYPDLAANPIHALGPVITRLADEIWCQGNEYFPATSKQIWELSGGAGASNIIPGEATIRFNFRFSNQLSAETIIERVHTLVAETLQTLATNTGKRYTYDLYHELAGEPFLTREGDLTQAMQAACQSVLGQSPKLSTGGGTSDARFVAPFGPQVVEFGPVNATIHQVDECVKIDDLPRLTQVYQRVLMTLYGKN
ncbi:succinyl-diaminopimelate desuccinylase [Ostreibacterium oceani]|uniref:Succinyl-diaminopimelate desuccinylase n=1 Tax=Ostreibacterium oceani TaxID=2654998 RepID=A0A6N7ESV0_9GAMM|nr:succinyl-diaminopimelate desuccinylase [Ostreibacterium oceani]MPV85621.1 succinyl-diaminopimelate desuccinylase [Ostreibacterium oceani]